ncbi:unnamed protein product [Brassica rapa]|uniref:Uncharacterized protein n=1 Tax=Brassica campestris TaxID=3711 RepID=A0A3P6A458_BRACM|nr:unnamed protein product [Brassica rapa]VDC86827.1 unnamed protein product [Brassica rapa]
MDHQFTGYDVGFRLSLMLLYSRYRQLDLYGLSWKILSSSIENM